MNSIISTDENSVNEKKDFFPENTDLPSRPSRFGLHHSFDVDLATELKSVELAILIHHFQYWIRFNASTGRNYHEGKTWSYQTLKDITALFPYWSQRQVEKLINKLVDAKILMKGNFNKSAYDRTVWYAFKNEARFGVFRNREIIEELGDISPNGEMDFAKRGNGNLQTVKPIPDSIPYAIPKINNSSLKVSSEAIAPDGASPPSASSEKRKKNSFLPSFEATELAEEMCKELEKGSPEYRRPKSLTNMAIEIEAMISKEKRDLRTIFEVFSWAIHDSFWKDKLYKPNPAKYLREKFTQLHAKMTAPKPKEKRRFAPSSNDAEAMKCFNKMMETAL